jgi:peptidylprolyl isomerase
VSALSALLLAATLGLAACGEDTPETTSTPEATEASTASDDSAGASIPKVSGKVGSTPTVAKPEGEPPTEVQAKDLVVGEGVEATEGANVTVDYHLVKWSDGSVVESSFTAGEPATFNLNGLIPCWQDELPGMKEGGRRVLVCTPDSAYGPAGSGSPLGGETLVFVIDLKSVNS